MLEKLNDKVGRFAAGKYIGRLAVFLLCVIMMQGFLTGCGEDGTRVVFTTGFGKDEVFRIGDSRCTTAELMVYLTNTQNRYESIYGAEVWNVSKDNVTLEENVKETVLARIAQVKTMCLLAESKGVELDEGEQQLAERAAEKYFDSLNETEIELMGVDEETVLRLYAEYALANKVYQEIIRDINPEISDDEARTITVQYILLRTYTADGAGTRIDYEQDIKAAVYEKACRIREQAVEEGQDFLDLASQYSEAGSITCSFGKGEMDTALEETAFAMETGEISQVIETASGYYILKCISTFDREQTELSKPEIVEQRRKQVFGEEYDAFAEALVRRLNTGLWEKIELIHDDAVDTTSFFDVYTEFFSD